MKGVFLDRETLKPEELDFNGLDAAASQWQYYPWSKSAEVKERIADAEVVVTNKTLITDADMAGAKNLKLICISATGTNNVDLEAARKRGISVCNVSGYAQGAVVQHTFALMLGLATSWNRYQESSYDGTWAKSPMFCLLDFPAVELANKTLGIVGYGSLGKKVAVIAEAMDMKVIIAQSPRNPNQKSEDRVGWDDFIAQADFITLHCPLTEHTENLINADTFKAMKPSAFVVNTARGGIVNELDLIEALKNKEIAGAALDVLTQEPPPADHPILQAQLPNLLLTPHTAWVTTEGRQRLLDGVVKNIHNFIAGTPSNVVN